MDKESLQRLENLTETINCPMEELSPNDPRLPNVMDYFYNLPSGTNFSYRPYSDKRIESAREELVEIYKNASEEDRKIIAKIANLDGLDQFN